MTTYTELLFLNRPETCQPIPGKAQTKRDLIFIRSLLLSVFKQIPYLITFNFFPTFTNALIALSKSAFV